MDEKRNLIFLVLALFFVFFIFGCVEPKENAVQKNEFVNEISGNEITETPEEKAEERFPNPDRSAYGNGIFIDENRNSYEQGIENAFLNLPEMPKDFAKVKFNLENGYYDALAPALGEKYYLQPEFLQNFEREALTQWKSPDLTHWGVYGYGFYPSALGYYMENQQSVDAYFFLHTAWNVETYQGAKIVPVLSDEMKGKFELEISPETILLEPTYPIVQKGWIYKIKVKITPKVALEKGEYAIKLEAASPDAKFNNEWGEKYENYFPAGGSGGGKSLVEIKIIVEK